MNCTSSDIYWIEGLPMNNTIISQTENLCQYMSLNHHEALYKTLLDVLYMAGTFLGGIFFGYVGETHGQRFSLGSAIFTTLMGTNIGLVRNQW